MTDDKVHIEQLNKEKKSKAEWAKTHAADTMVYKPDCVKGARLEQLKDKVSDLCDLQPTPVSMLRPSQKEALSDLRSQLVQALEDVESEIEVIGGSVTVASSKLGDGASVASAQTSASRGPKLSKGRSKNRHADTENLIS